MPEPIVRVFDDEHDLAVGTAGALLFAAMEAVARRGHFHWALAGGSTPRATYRVLAAPPFADDFPWDRHDAWLGDERCVPADHPASNARMIREHLFRPAGAEETALRAFDTETDPDAAARAYAEQLAAAVPKNDGGVPVLDVVLLGLGADAHTASWFPGSSFPEDRWVAASAGQHGGQRRLTLTPTIVNAARRVVFLVAGETKTDALRRVLQGPHDPVRVPAQRVAPEHGKVTWMLDAAAAGQFFAG
ncbi:MAG: 6-phosphogluconolactonase [Acidobacteria bacterium]|nr:6-phosphogluconolactonase [Acidobacteriota bacterium]NIM63363.1 6-phosphogluconolactonase [Acidobacteriota bacterium]NIO60072.1 6-phosphogluconolactonase [Acidobacteriota bacterium]NIQ31480.1 6-phosphogluconolactonase [Acidobacteriota bacterium]NIQ86255.1 6-phosphogluconolactonase [Acidobacteriota bacterium]